MTILLITVCNKYLKRVSNIIKMLDSQQEELSSKNIVPVFLHGSTPLDINIPYDTLQVDIEEQYTNLYKKLISGFAKLYEKYNFKHVIKIDDDTFINVQMLDNFTEDYVGRFLSTYSDNTITIDLPMYNIYKKILIRPSFFADKFKFATGDFYVLSRQAVAFIVDYFISNISIPEDVYVCEDQLIGYIMSHANFSHRDITYENKLTLKHNLQVTEKCASIHPIHESYMAKLINISPLNQISVIANSTICSMSKTMQLNILEDLIKKTINDFANTLKPSGLG